jgi:hypothetical protein
VSEDGSSESPEPITPVEQAQPQLPQAQPPAPGAKPKWLSALAITAMVLGGLFGCCGVTSLGGQVMNRAINPMMAQMTASDPQNPEVAAFMERNAQLQARIFPFALTTGLLGLLHSIALLVAGIMTQNGRASGRGLLVLVCLVGIAVELINGGVSVYVSRETNAMTEQMMKATFAAQRADPTPEDKQAQEMGQKFASGAARAGSILGIVMIVFFFAIKTAYYIVTARYLQRKDVLEYFETPRSTAAA